MRAARELGDERVSTGSRPECPRAVARPIFCPFLPFFVRYPRTPVGLARFRSALPFPNPPLPWPGLLRLARQRSASRARSFLLSESRSCQSYFPPRSPSWVAPVSPSRSAVTAILQVSGGKSEWSATGLAASLGRRFSPLADGCIRGAAALGAAAASLSHTSGLRAVHGQRRRDVDILFLRVHIQMATSSLLGYE